MWDSDRPFNDLPRLPPADEIEFLPDVKDWVTELDEAIERLEERERNWQRLMRELGLTAVVCDLAATSDAELLETARSAQWPAPLNGGDL